MVKGGPHLGGVFSLLVENATFVTMVDGVAPFVGYMAVSGDGRIAAIASGPTPDGLDAHTRIDATGKILLPGFVSAHSHVWQSAFRGIAPCAQVDAWGQAVRVFSARASDDDLYWFTLHGALDHLRHGITSVFNFGYAHRPGEYNSAQLRGLLTSGVRSVHAFAQARTLPVAEQYESFVRYFDFAEQHTGNPLLLAHGLTGSGSSRDQALLGRRLMDEFGVLNQAHYLENPRLRAGEQACFQNFVDAGAIGPSQYFGHFIHTTDDILDVTAAAGSGMSWQPLANGRLGSGIADIPKYIAKGVRVGMGLDGQASADIADAFENMRAGLYALRAKYEDAAIMSAEDVLRLHTMSGAELMGAADRIGSLDVGKYADFLVISPSTPVFDPVSTIVFASTRDDIEAVFIAGEQVTSGPIFIRSDWDAIRHELESRVQRIIKEGTART